MKLFTIGHSNHPAGEFIYLLAAHTIALLVDVRSTPCSRFNPHFNRNALQQLLQASGIQYIYAGDRLGGRPKDPTCYQHHTLPTRAADFMTEIDYAQVMKRPWFCQGIDDVLERAGSQTTCLMCSEKDPLNCHRHLLIATYLLTWHPEVAVWHILADGSLADAHSIRSGSEEAHHLQSSF